MPVAKYRKFSCAVFPLTGSRRPVHLTVFVNVFLWGIVVACTSAATDFSGLIASRFFLGIFEATVGKLYYDRSRVASELTVRSSMLHYCHANGMLYPRSYCDVGG